ncbi:MAG TPA: ribbon-helix-helix domain-containing protein [Candidatus Saccharimonadales bacterium]
MSQKRTRHTAKATRIQLTLPAGLLKLVDQAAEEDFTTRSDMIRMAILWYLRPQGRELNQADPEEILKTLQHRKTRVAVKKMLRETPED